MLVTEHNDAWQELYDAIPRGWEVGRPPYDHARRRWRLYGYDRRLARRGRADTVTVEAESEEQAVREMARRLREARSPRR
jgi:hypothetical protein